MKTKKIMSAALSAAVLLSLAGCAGDMANDTVTESESPASVSAPTSEESETSEASESVSNALTSAEAAAAPASGAPSTSAAAVPEAPEQTLSAPASESAVSTSAAASSNTAAKAPDETSITDLAPYEEYSLSDKEFTFESNTVNGKKLLISFTASPVEKGSDIYGTDTAASVSVFDETENKILQSDILRTPLSDEETFLYHSDYDIQTKFVSCGDGASCLGLVCVPKGDGTYFTSLYVYRSLKFTIITDLFPEVESIDDISLDGSKLSFYDAPSGKNVSYRLDLSGFTSQKLPDTANVLSLDELESESKDKPKLTAHPFHFPEGAAPGGGNPPIEYNGTTYEYHFDNGEYFIDKDKNVIDLGAWDNDWQLDPENKLDALMMKFNELEYIGRITSEYLGLSGGEEMEMYRYGDYLIFIFQSEFLPMYSADFRKVFFGFDYFSAKDAEILNMDPSNLTAVFSEHGLEYDPDIFLGALLYEKAVRVNGVLVSE